MPYKRSSLVSTVTPVFLVPLETGMNVLPTSNYNVNELFIEAAWAIY